MKLHASTIKELIRIMETHGGHREEHRLRDALGQLDLSTYQQNSTGKEVIVLTEELVQKGGG